MTAAPQDAELGFRILNWIGIIEQLISHRASRRLAALALTVPQFALLNHFSHRPEERRTVTQLARVMQQTQPAITKTVKALVAAGYLRVRTDKDDRRVKWLKLTARGQKVRARAIDLMGPDIAKMFGDWRAEEMDELMALLDRLKRYLDENRP